MAIAVLLLARPFLSFPSHCRLARDEREGGRQPRASEPAERYSAGTAPYAVRRARVDHLRVHCVLLAGGDQRVGSCLAILTRFPRRDNPTPRLPCRWTTANSNRECA